MTIRHLLSVFAILAWTAGMAQTARLPAVVLPCCHVDTAKYVVFSASSGLSPLVRRKVLLFITTPDQVDQTECILRAFHRRCEVGGNALVDSLTRTTKGMVYAHFDAINLDKALRQYLGGTDKQGQDLIYLNGLCPGESKVWRTKWVPVKGSGPCSFRAVVNLTLGTIEVLTINAPE